MKQYVRITFKPAGAKRKRTCWAVKLKATATRVSYLLCNSEGETEQVQGTVPNETVTTHMVVGTPGEVTERPARMNLKYAELELDVDSHA